MLELPQIQRGYRDLEEVREISIRCTKPTQLRGLVVTLWRVLARPARFLGRLLLVFCHAF